MGGSNKFFGASFPHRTVSNQRSRSRAACCTVWLKLDSASQPPGNRPTSGWFSESSGIRAAARTARTENVVAGVMRNAPARLSDQALRRRKAQEMLR
jgi:hypothetical protein